MLMGRSTRVSSACAWWQRKSNQIPGTFESGVWLHDTALLRPVFKVRTSVPVISHAADKVGTGYRTRMRLLSIAPSGTSIFISQQSNSERTVQHLVHPEEMFIPPYDAWKISLRKPPGTSASVLERLPGAPSLHVRLSSTVDGVQSAS